VLPASHSDHNVANPELARLVGAHRPRLIGFGGIQAKRDAGRIRALAGLAVQQYPFRGPKVHRDKVQARQEVCASPIPVFRTTSSPRVMNTTSQLGRIVREESARIQQRGLLRETWSTSYLEDELDEMIRYWLEVEAGTAACNSRVARLPLRRPVPYVGTRAGPFQEQGIVFNGWSGWRGAYSFAELHGILNNVAIPGMSTHDQATTQRIFSQNCMVYRYRFQGTDLRTAGYIGSATGDNSLRERLSLEIRIRHPGSNPTRGRQSPQGLQHVISQLQTASGRGSFRLDIGSVGSPGIRNRSTVYQLEKLLQLREHTYGNPIGVRSFEDFEQEEYV
jgi:hypothetical protein